MSQETRQIVHIVEAERAVGEGLCKLLRADGFEPVWSLNSHHLVIHLTHRTPDMIVIGMEFGGQNGLFMLRWLKSRYKHVPIVMLSEPTDFETALKALRGGAAGVVAKPVDPQKFLDLARKVLRRVDRPGSRVKIRGIDELTPREHEVLQLITGGQTNKEAARDLGISPKTVEVHRARVMEKLGARNAADLVRIALTH